MRRHYIISYDVNTEDSAGRARLRKVSRLCVNFGTRVQYSVFELSVSQKELNELKDSLLKIMNLKTDSLRIYCLPGGRGRCVESFGVQYFSGQLTADCQPRSSIREIGGLEN